MARLVVYVAAAPGAGKTRRLLSDARRMRNAGTAVRIDCVETHGHADLEQLQRECQACGVGNATEKADVVILDELACGDRWKQALELRRNGTTVYGACDISEVQGHGDRTAPIPFSFLEAADEVVAVDASPELLRRRQGETALDEQHLLRLRERLLRTIDDLTIATISAANMSTAVAIVPADIDAANFVHRSAAVAAAFDLQLQLLPSPLCDPHQLASVAHENDAELLDPEEPQQVDTQSLRASMIAIPSGPLAKKLVNVKVARDIFVVDTSQSYVGHAVPNTPLSGTLGDRLGVGYGRLTVYLGAAPGVGTTIAMLDRGQQLRESGVDVVAGIVEAHGRPETIAAAGNLEIIPASERSTGTGVTRELNRAAILARKPAVVLVDDLFHLNAPGALAPKRYLDVLAMLRSGINVVTTLGVIHLEALTDAVQRVTGTTVEETLPDSILSLADEVILVDAAPDELIERLRAGKIYPRDRVEKALKTLFRPDSLAALRELAIREALRYEGRERIEAPFERLLLSVVAREGDLEQVRRASRMAARLQVEFTIAHVAETHDRVDAEMLARFHRAAQAIDAEWIDERVPDAPRRLLEIARARDETTIAVGGTLRTPRWPARAAFARRLLDSGARELIVLARREGQK